MDLWQEIIGIAILFSMEYKALQRFVML